MKGGGGAEGECEKKRAFGVLLCHSLGHRGIQLEKLTEPTVAKFFLYYSDKN